MQTRQIIDEVRNHYGGKVFGTEIRDDPAIENAAGYGQPVFEHASDSQGASDDRNLVDEVIDRIGRYRSRAFCEPASRGGSGFFVPADRSPDAVALERRLRRRRLP